METWTRATHQMRNTTLRLGQPPILDPRSSVLPWAQDDHDVPDWTSLKSGKMSLNGITARDARLIFFHLFDS